MNDCLLGCLRDCLHRDSDLISYCLQFYSNQDVEQHYLITVYKKQIESQRQVSH